MKPKRKKTGPNPVKKRKSGSHVWKFQLQNLWKKNIGSVDSWKKILGSSVLRKQISGERKNPAPPCLFNGRFHMSLAM